MTNSLIIARQQEQFLLLKALNSSSSELIALYGRRRVGKTFLVRQVSSKFECMEVVGLKGGSKKEELAIFQKSLEETFLQGSVLSPFKSWAAAFEELNRQLKKRTSKKPFVLFLDELPWLATRRGGLLEAIDHNWNAFWSKDSRLKIILCGSAASWMIKNVLDNKGGLHNRATLRLHLTPFSLRETELYLHSRGVSWTRSLILEAYLCLGGVPYYLNEALKKDSPAQMIERACFSPHGNLHNEYNRLFSSLFDDAQAHYKIVEVIGRHHYGISRSDLIKGTKLSSGGRLESYLTELREAGFIEEFLPYGRNAREYSYRLIDAFCLFYHRWLKQFVHGRGRTPSQGLWNKLRSTSNYASWAGYAFENVVHAHTEELLSALHLEHVITTVTPWKNSQAQIDLIIDREDGIIHICEIKHTQGEFEVTPAFIREMEKKKAAFIDTFSPRKQVVFTVISPFGIKKTFLAGKEIHSEVTLDDLFRTRKATIQKEDF